MTIHWYSGSSFIWHFNYSVLSSFVCLFVSEQSFKTTAILMNLVHVCLHIRARKSTTTFKLFSLYVRSLVVVRSLGMFEWQMSKKRWRRQYSNMEISTGLNTAHTYSYLLEISMWNSNTMIIKIASIKLKNMSKNLPQSFKFHFWNFVNHSFSESLFFFQRAIRIICANTKHILIHRNDVLWLKLSLWKVV